MATMWAAVNLSPPEALHVGDEEIAAALDFIAKTQKECNQSHNQSNQLQEFWAQGLGDEGFDEFKHQ